MKFLFRGYVYEAVSINKQYLLGLANGDTAKFQSAKSEAEKILLATAMTIKESDKIKIVSLLCHFILKGGLPPDVSKFLHDIIVDNNLALLFKLNSDSTTQDFANLIDSYQLNKMSSGDALSQDESCIWLRVKVFHDFGDGFKWIIAVDENGNPVGYMPTAITDKTMRHCGNQPSVENGDVYYGLRDSHNKEYVTVILDIDSNIKESKGYNNSPPKNKSQINKYMQWLMMHPIVKGTSYSHGYARHMNYGVSQMLDDDEFLEKVEKEKPELINADVDRIILDWRGKLKRGETTVEELKEMYLNKKLGHDFMFEHLIGIVGSNPFTEAEMVSYINERKLKGVEIGNAGNQYLTIPVQHALVDNNDFRVLTEVYFNVPTNKIDFQYIIDSYQPKDIHNLFNIIPVERKSEILDKYSFGEGILDQLFYSEYTRVPRLYNEEGGGYTQDDTQQAEFLRKLIDKGGLSDSIVSARTDNGRFLIAKNIVEFPNILKIFLEKGLNPNDTVDSRSGETLFDYTMSRPYVKNDSILEMLQRGAEVKESSIWEAYASRKYDMLELLLSHTKNPSYFMTYMYNDSSTLLMMTARDLEYFDYRKWELTKVLDMLFKYGSNANQLNPQGRNCMDFAIYRNGDKGTVSTDVVGIIVLFMQHVLDNGFELTDELYKKYYDIVKGYPYFGGDYEWRGIRDLMDEYIE